MFDPTGYHGFDELVPTIVMYLLGLISIIYCIVAIRSNSNRKRNGLLLCIGFLWLVLTTTVGLSSGHGFVGLYLGGILYAPIHVICWLIISVVSLLTVLIKKIYKKY